MERRSTGHFGARTGKSTQHANIEGAHRSALLQISLRQSSSPHLARHGFPIGGTFQPPSEAGPRFYACKHDIQTYRVQSSLGPPWLGNSRSGLRCGSSQPCSASPHFRTGAGCCCCVCAPGGQQKEEGILTVSGQQGRHVERLSLVSATTTGTHRSGLPCKAGGGQTTIRKGEEWLQVPLGDAKKNTNMHMGPGAFVRASYQELLQHIT